MATAHAERSNYVGMESVRRCRSCLSASLRVDWQAGDRVCTSCGLVDEEHLLDEGAEWRNFDEADDLVRNAHSGGAGGARCGMVATNEQRWLGGLQPTSLSKYIYGGPTRTSIGTRKKLVTANQRLDHIMEKRHKKDVKDAQLDVRIRKRKLTKPVAGDDEEAAEELEPLHPGSNNLLVHEDDDGLVNASALYSDKWSMQRAIRLFGQAHEVQSFSQGSFDKEEEMEALRKGMDEVLTNAARDLYAAYTALLKAAKKLELPDRVTNEALATLVKYAARRDGLSVRGVSSQLKQKKGKSAKGAEMTAAEKCAMESLRNFNRLRQIGSLVAAIIFYTARNLSWPRALSQVCESVETPEELQDSRFLDVGNGPFIKKKHCSKAMNEIKHLFPDFARTAVVPSAVTLDDASTESFVDHVTRKLRLPPVAEACIRAIVAHIKDGQESSAESQSNRAKKRLVVCAASSYFVCQLGGVMQRLAQQASERNSSQSSPSFKKRRLGPDSSEVVKDKQTEGVSKDIMDSDDDEDDDLIGGEEHRAYEQRRLWDAWKEQTNWSRSATEVEQVCGVPHSGMESFFKKSVYPKRGELLKLLSTQIGGDSALGKVPLASVLLPQVTIAEPLLKSVLN